MVRNNKNKELVMLDLLKSPRARVLVLLALVAGVALLVTRSACDGVSVSNAAVDAGAVTEQTATEVVPAAPVESAPEATPEVSQ